MLIFLLLGLAQVYRELAEEVVLYRNQTFATNTKHTYNTNQTSYLRFCRHMKRSSVPASPQMICLYAAFLARSQKFSSIKQSLGIIGLMHKEFGLPNPLIVNWHVSSLLTGVKRVLEDAPHQKLPITLDILRRLYSQLNLSFSINASFWAICLVAFFGMFHLSP